MLKLNITNKIRKLMTDRVEEVIEKFSLEKKLRSGRSLRIKVGADPSSPDLHLGHAVILQKIREFQELGHKAVFIIGDFTARIGDPSGKSRTRPILSPEEIKKNTRTYLNQVGKILDIKKTEVRFNSEWFSAAKLEDFIKIAANFSAQRIMDREDFKKRILSGQEVAFHETIYLIMQAYDSVAVGADVEIGGQDQRLNMLAGRELQKKMGLKEQDLVIMPLLVGVDGKEKMSKSLNNFIALLDSPDDMFGKIMSIPDRLILNYWGLAALATPAELKDVDRRLNKENPRDIKSDLASRVVALYHGPQDARRAKDKFSKIFSQKEYSVPLVSLSVPLRGIKIIDLVLKSAALSSKSAARRLISDGAVEIDQRVIHDAHEIIKKHAGRVLRIGKKNFFKLQ